MNIVSSGLTSGRVYTVSIMQAAQRKLPSSQNRIVTKMANRLSHKTGLGFYDSLHFLAILGTHLSQIPSSRLQLSTSTAVF